MEFGIFSNGFRPHTTAAQTYDEDLYEIVLADKLGFTEAFISEHHGEPAHIDRVDTTPNPELLMCKAAGPTSQIRMGAAVKLAHLQHPLELAVQGAVVEHLLGKGRYIFGFGSGFPRPLFCEERGLTFDDRHERLQESIDFILKCWRETEPFDWNGKHWKSKGALALPKPLTLPHPQLAIASDKEATIRFAAENGAIMLASFLETAEGIRPKTDMYEAFGKAAGIDNPRQHISASRVIFVADSEQEAMDLMRPDVTFEVSVQAERGFLKMLKNVYGVEIPNDTTAIEALVDVGFYILGDPETVAEKIEKHFNAVGGFGTLQLVAGKNWATREDRARSMTRFMEEVAPMVRHLTAA